MSMYIRDKALTHPPPKHGKAKKLLSIDKATSMLVFSHVTCQMTLMHELQLRSGIQV